MLRDIDAEDKLDRNTDVEDALSFLEGYYGLPNFVTVPVQESVETPASRRARTLPERLLRLRGAAWAAKGHQHGQPADSGGAVTRRPFRQTGGRKRSITDEL